MNSVHGNSRAARRNRRYGLYGTRIYGCRARTGLPPGLPDRTRQVSSRTPIKTVPYTAVYGRRTGHSTISFSGADFRVRRSRLKGIDLCVIHALFAQSLGEL